MQQKTLNTGLFFSFGGLSNFLLNAILRKKKFKFESIGTDTATSLPGQCKNSAFRSRVTKTAQLCSTVHTHLSILFFPEQWNHSATLSSCLHFISWYVHSIPTFSLFSILICREGPPEGNAMMCCPICLWYRGKTAGLLEKVTYEDSKN